MVRRVRFGVAAAVLCTGTWIGTVLAAQTPAPPTRVWSVPTGFPAPPVPADNPLTDAKIELGRRLFYDPRLSSNGTQSCSTCHEQARAFTDGRARSLGSCAIRASPIPGRTDRAALPIPENSGRAARQF
jgi:cytochrome c peroxidase